MLQIEHLTFRYATASAPAVTDLNFSVIEGEIFGCLGPSGAGKSTMQKILIGLLKGYQGHVTAFGRDLASWGQAYYERIGVSFELPNHFLKLTARENLDYFRSLYHCPTHEAIDALALVGLANDADTPVGQFSKGMKLRLNLARALLHRPALLFLDEPTSGLDPVTARTIKDLIAAERARGTTIFLTTHNMTIAEELCDRVALLVDGQIRLIDAPKALKLRYGAPTVRVEYISAGQPASVEFPLGGLGENPAFLDALHAGELQTIHTQEATLEQVFIAATGRTL